jgi:hypothetical protein
MHKGSSNGIDFCEASVVAKTQNKDESIHFSFPHYHFAPPNTHAHTHTKVRRHWRILFFPFSTTTRSLFHMALKSDVVCEDRSIDLPAFL